MTTQQTPKVLTPNNRRRIGEQLLADGLISGSQLKQVLQHQSQVGGQIGSILIEMGYVHLEDLLDLLGRQFGVPGINLYQWKIAQEVLQLLSPQQMADMKVLPLALDGKTLILAMVNPEDQKTISSLELSLGKTIKPVVMPAFMVENAIRYVTDNPGVGLRGDVLAEMEEIEKGEKAPGLMQLLRYAKKKGANDMLLTAGSPPAIKDGNSLKRMAIPALTPEDCRSYAREMVDGENWQTFKARNELDFSATFEGIGRFRVALYRQRGSISMALRPIMDKVPQLSALNLPEWLAKFALCPRGLILITSPASQGKSTTLAAMVDVINSRRGCNIITLEDPVEYLHTYKKSNINQREVGRDVASFAEGMRTVLRHAPDVIVVDEMRDKETCRAALQAANAGQLVLATLHSDNATSSIERIVNLFEPHEQRLVRGTLADSLLLSLSQRLITKKDGNGRILALEYFINSSRMKAVIREGKIQQVRTQMQKGGKHFLGIDLALARLVKKGVIRAEEGLNHCEDNRFYRGLIQPPEKEAESQEDATDEQSA